MYHAHQIATVRKSTFLHLSSNEVVLSVGASASHLYLGEKQFTTMQLNCIANPSNRFLICFCHFQFDTIHNNLPDWLKEFLSNQSTFLFKHHEKELLTRKSRLDANTYPLSIGKWIYFESIKTKMKQNTTLSGKKILGYAGKQILHFKGF